MSRWWSSFALAESWAVDGGADPQVAWMIGELTRRFERATGWPLRYVPPSKALQDPEAEGSEATFWLGRDPSAGQLRLDVPRKSPTPPSTSLDAAVSLAAVAARLLGDWLRSRGPTSMLHAAHPPRPSSQAPSSPKAKIALAPRGRSADEAEGSSKFGSTGVEPSKTEPSKSEPAKTAEDGLAQLAERLDRILHGACEAMGCAKAGLYLLDDDTTSLVLRAASGFAADRLGRGRPLGDARADLEALCGYAVTLDDRRATREWRAPEDVGSAVCVPVASAAQPLGTLWLFSEPERRFEDAEVSLAEAVAGRLAVELERYGLWATCREKEAGERSLQAAAAGQAQLRPSAAQSTHFEWAGWAGGPDGLTGDFCDWAALPNGRLAFVVGDVWGRGASSSLAAEHLRGAFQAHVQYQDHAGRLLNRMNQSAVRHPSRDALTASAYCATLDLGTGLMGYASAGQMLALRWRGDAWQRLHHPSLPLGVKSEDLYSQFQMHLSPEEVLLVLTNAAAQPSRSLDGSTTLEAVQRLIEMNLHQSAQTLAHQAASTLADRHSQPGSDDWAVFVVKGRY